MRFAWKVKYDCKFSSASDGKPYSIPYINKETIVITNENDPSYIRDILDEYLGIQTELNNITSIEFLGSVINR